MRARGFYQTGFRNGSMSIVESMRNAFLLRVRNPPAVRDIPVSVNEDGTLAFSAATFDAAFFDQDADTLQIVRIRSLPSNGTLRLSGVAVVVDQEIARSSLGSLTYTPAANFNGADTFDYNASDGFDYAATSARVNITVNPVNDPPTFNTIANQTVNEDSGAQSVSITGVSPGGGSDEAGQSVTLTAISSNPAIVPDPTITGTRAARTLTFTPAPNANTQASGPVTITVLANDNQGVNNTFSRTFTITVNSLNPVPVLYTLSPDSAAAAGAGFTLTINGSSFEPDSVIRWNGAARPTTYVSATQLTAEIPASDIANSGSANVTVFNPAPGGGTSNTLVFLIGVPRLSTQVSLSRSGGQIVAMLVITNSGNATAGNVQLNTATLQGPGGTFSGSPLPQPLGNIAPGLSVVVTVSFSGAAGSPGESGSLRLSGSFLGGTFGPSLRVTLP